MSNIEALQKLSAHLRMKEPLQMWFGMGSEALSAAFWKAYHPYAIPGQHHSFIVEWDGDNPAFVVLFCRRTDGTRDRVADVPVDEAYAELLVAALRSVAKTKRVDELLFSARLACEQQADEELDQLLR